MTVHGVGGTKIIASFFSLIHTSTPISRREAWGQDMRLALCLKPCGEPSGVRGDVEAAISRDLQAQVGNDAGNSARGSRAGGPVLPATPQLMPLAHSPLINSDSDKSYSWHRQGGSRLLGASMEGALSSVGLADVGMTGALVPKHRLQGLLWSSSHQASL